MVAHRHVFLRVRDETFTLRIYIYQLTQCNTLISKLHHSTWFSFLIHMNYYNVRIMFIIIRNCMFCNCLNHILNEDAIFTFKYIIWVITHHGLQNMYSHVFSIQYTKLFFSFVFSPPYTRMTHTSKKEILCKDSSGWL